MKNQKSKIKSKNNEVAIKVENLSKTFRIPHEKITTLKGAALGLFSKKNYTKLKALENVNFEVKKGEFFGIIGRNGSGKSTLLKILAGIYVSDMGKTTINGKLSPFLELGVGFNPELTGRGNLYLGGAILGLTRKEIDEKFDEIVTFSELHEFIDMKLKNYSSGMQVRLAFSLAINAHAEILLMDEVLAVGDSNFQSKCLTEFNKYKEMGKTVILVTHDVAVVQRYCDRAMLLRNGKIVEIGKADKAANKYINQNMSDEEYRTSKEELGDAFDESEDSIARKKARITRVEFLDKNGKNKNVFETGDDISVKIYFEHKKSIEDLNFGIAILNQENHYAFGINTFIDKVNTKKFVKRGYCQIDYKGIPLKANSYYVNFAIYGTDSNIAYDFMPKSNLFRVFSRDKYYGMVNIKHRWV